MELPVLSVNVGVPRVIGLQRGEPVLSGIAKAPVASATVFVGATNIEGDGQADLSVHGGVDKAVYAYPSGHWPWWEREKAFACRPAAFGENLTVAGADETAIAIGDRFRWGEALLEVSQPRAPCFKFAIYAERADAPAAMTASGRCGWYFRVIVPGRAPVDGAMLVREVQSGGPNVRDAFFAALDPRVSAENLAWVHAAPALAQSWRDSVARRLGPV
jgi:MOSC domain-containing protein YiiM